jgi:hypothetical protein
MSCKAVKKEQNAERKKEKGKITKEKRNRHKKAKIKYS